MLKFKSVAIIEQDFVYCIAASTILLFDLYRQDFQQSL